MLDDILASERVQRMRNRVGESFQMVDHVAEVSGGTESTLHAAMCKVLRTLANRELNYEDTRAALASLHRDLETTMLDAGESLPERGAIAFAKAFAVTIQNLLERLPTKDLEACELEGSAPSISSLDPPMQLEDSFAPEVKRESLEEDSLLELATAEATVFNTVSPLFQTRTNDLNKTSLENLQMPATIVKREPEEAEGEEESPLEIAEPEEDEPIPSTASGSVPSAELQQPQARRIPNRHFMRSIPEKHVRTVYDCKMCSAEVYKTCRQSHVYADHLNLILFECPLCDYSSTNAISHVTRHIKSTHQEFDKVHAISHEKKYEKEINAWNERCFPGWLTNGLATSFHRPLRAGYDNSTVLEVSTSRSGEDSGSDFGLDSDSDTSKGKSGKRPKRRISDWPTTSPKRTPTEDDEVIVIE